MKFTPFKLEQYFARYEFTARYMLSSSDCESMPIADLLALEDGAPEAFHAQWLGYTEAPGSPTLRAEISTMYDTLQAEDVLALAGAEEGVFLFAAVALNPGDHVISVFPAYQSLYQIATDMGCEVTLWPLNEHEGGTWAYDLDFLRDTLRPNTRAIVINSPHNPTGALMSEAEMRAVAAIAGECRAYVFFDEVYRFLEWDAQPVPAMADLYENAISLGVMSKTFGLPGLRIGWVATRNRDLLVAMQEQRYYTTICNSAPSEFLAALALRHRDKLVERSRNIIRANMAHAEPVFEALGETFGYAPPAAGPICFPRYLGGDVDAFAAAVVEAQGVMILPGTVYDDTGNHFRLGLGRLNFPQALAQLAAYLSHTPKVR